MTDQSTDTCRAEQPAADTKAPWPDEPIGMLNAMRSEQAKALHDMFTSLRTRSMETFQDYPEDAEAYVRLALRAQANCRMTMADIVRTELAARQDQAESQK